jgi:hypothetical protein
MVVWEERRGCISRQHHQSMSDSEFDDSAFKPSLAEEASLVCLTYSGPP